MIDYKAFRLTLVAICYLVTLACVLGFFDRYNEVIGVGGAVVGLIGFLKAPESGR